MRLLGVVLVVAAACGKSGSTGEKGGPPEPAKPAPPAVAAAAAADAAPAKPAAPAGPALPAAAICTGHWTATGLNFASSKTCDDAKLAPYTELDAVLAAGPQGWTATVSKPAGLTVGAVSVHWSVKEPADCSADLLLKSNDVELRVELSRGPADRASAARIDIGHGDGACMGSGIAVDATFTADAGGLPPPAPALTAFAGAYQIELELPARYKCEVAPAAKQSFQIGIDRGAGDALTATGLEWEVAEVRDNEDGELYLRIGVEGEEAYSRLLLLLHPAGNQVTGTFEYTRNDPDEESLCKPIQEGKVTGTRTP